MARFYARILSLLVLMLMLFVVTMRAAGSTQPLHPALIGFEQGCENYRQPCWFGIHTGMYSAELDEQLTSVGYVEDFYGHEYSHSVYCDVDAGNDPSTNGGLYGFTLTNCGLLLGDLIAYWGMPVVVDHFYEDRLTVYFSNNVQVVIEVPFSPQSPVISLDVNSYASCELSLPENAWHGFAPYWRYQQLEPNTQVICYAID